MSEKKKDDDILTEAKEAFKKAQDAESDNREAWEDDVRFARLGEQWPAEIKKQRESEGRPCLTINRMPAFIRQVVNDARMNTPSIKTHPCDDDADPKTAKILDGLIRNIEYTSNADVAYDTALEHAVTGGFGYFRIDLDYARDDTFDLDIKVSRIVNPLTVYGDPHSEACDASDWMKAFVTELMPKSEFVRKWKDGEKVDWDSYGDGKDLEWFQEETVRIAEYWKREEVDKPIVLLSSGEAMSKKQYEDNSELFDISGITVVDERVTKSYKVTQYIMTGAELLETNEWPGKYIPIIPVYGDEVFVEGKRYLLSLIRFAKDPQRMFNYWRTTGTELIALAPKAPWIGRKGTFDSDIDRWNTANTQSHAFLEYDTEMPQRQPFAGVPGGVIQEALNSSDDMKSVMGLYDASLGARSNETSGRAIIMRQREGDVGTYNFIDNLSRAMQYAGRVLVDLIPNVYSKQRVVRIINEDESSKNVKVNAPHVENGVEQIYDLTIGKYDVTVESGPSFTTKREESATQMMELLRSFPQAAPVIGDLIAKNLDWPGADKIAERLKAMLPPQVQQLDKMDGIPDEAKPIVGMLHGQMQQMKQQMDQGMQMFQMMKQENDRLKLEIANKRETNQVTLQKAAMDNAAKIEVEEIKSAGDFRLEMMGLIKQALDQYFMPTMPVHGMPPPNQHMMQQPPPGGFFMPEQQG